MNDVFDGCRGADVSDALRRDVVAGVAAGVLMTRDISLAAGLDELREELPRDTRLSVLFSFSDMTTDFSDDFPDDGGVMTATDRDRLLPDVVVMLRGDVILTSRPLDVPLTGR